MAAIHISQTEAERTLHSLLARVDEHTSFVIEHESQPIALLQAVARPLSSRERIARLPRDTDAVMDDAFAEDVLAAIAAHREPLRSSPWDE